MSDGEDEQNQASNEEDPHSDEERCTSCFCCKGQHKSKGDDQWAELQRLTKEGNLDDVKTFLENKDGDQLEAADSKGETILHSLIRLAITEPVTEPTIETIFRHLRDHKIYKDDSKRWRSLWFKENHKGMTPLRLAAYLGSGSVCASVLSLEDVYCFQEDDKTVKYDISELDSVTFRQWLDRREKGITRTERRKRAFDMCRDEWTRRKSVLELLYASVSGQIYLLMAADIVQELVTEKWRQLCPYFYLWLVCHVLFMIGLICYAVYRDWTPLTPGQHALVDFWPYLNVVLAGIYMVLEVIRTFYHKNGWYLRGNGFFRSILIFFSVCLLVDFTWEWLDPENVSGQNFFLVLAVLSGCTFTMFFLRIFRKFAFFTIMFQKIMMGDLVRFSGMILLLLVSFTVSIYVSYVPLGTQRPDEFYDVPRSFLTMFRLMLGLTDLEVLYEAPEPWLTIFLYVLFVLLTYVLLLNALIAMMSKTCELVKRDRHQQWYMQRLSVELMLETCLLDRLRPKLCDEPKAKKHRKIKVLPQKSTPPKRVAPIPDPLDSDQQRTRPDQGGTTSGQHGTKSADQNKDEGRYLFKVKQTLRSKHKAADKIKNILARGTSEFSTKGDASAQLLRSIDEKLSRVLEPLQQQKSSK